MTENEQYVADSITQWVWSGFYTHDDIEEMIEDIAEEDCDMDELRSLIGPALRAKLRAERAWPTVTDCERLDKVFYDLHEAGICALSNAGYTQSDGRSDVAEAVANAPANHYTGYCFYHGQDVESAVDGHGLWLAFGDLEGDQDGSIQVGETVVQALRQAGFIVDWNGAVETRISLPVFDWKKRASR